MRIFISYGHDEHEALAERLNDDLVGRGHETWYDKKDLKPGMDWEEFIEKGLDFIAGDPKNGRFLILMTPHSVRRPDGYCLNEISRALSRWTTIVPIMVAWCEPPLSICRIQWLDMQDCIPPDSHSINYNVKLNSLVDALVNDQLDFGGVQSRLLFYLEQLSYESDIARHLVGFTGRKWVFDRIDAWLANPQAPRIFSIYGGPGTGKTAISAWICSRHREMAAVHFCTAGHSDKSDPRKIVMSIAYQLSTQLKDYESRLVALNLERIVKELNAASLFDVLIVQPLSRNFPRPEHMIVILIDALDEAGEGRSNELAEFIAAEFPNTPDWLRLIVTSRPNTEVTFPFQGLDIEEMRLEGPENELDLRDYLIRELKPFVKDDIIPDETLEFILKQSEGVFLYVKYIVDELNNRRLSLDKIDEFPRSLGSTYVRFLKRQFPASSNGDRPGKPDLVFYEQECIPLLEIIAAAREPPEMSQVISILGWDQYKKNKVVDSFGSLLTIYNGRIRPFHRSLMEWLTNERSAGPYLISEAEGHKLLAERGWSEYAGGMDKLSRYNLLYLPTHLMESGRSGDLASLLTDPGYFLRFWGMDIFLVMATWVRIEERSSLRMVDVYKGLIDSPGSYDGMFALGVATLLHDAGHIFESIPIREYLVERYRNDNDFIKLQEAIGDLAWSYYIQGSLEKSRLLLEEQENICRNIGYKKGLQIALARLANIYLDKDMLDKAMGLYKEQETISRDLNDLKWVEKSLGNQGLIYSKLGDLGSAIVLFHEQERICREIGYKIGLQVAINNRANIYLEVGDTRRAMGLYREQARICGEIGYRLGLSCALGNQALIHHKNGETEPALRLYKEQERICTDLGNVEGQARALIHRACLTLQMLKQPKVALELAERAYHIVEEKDMVDLIKYIEPRLRLIREKQAGS